MEGEHARKRQFCGEARLECSSRGLPSAGRVAGAAQVRLGLSGVRRGLLARWRGENSNFFLFLLIFAPSCGIYQHMKAHLSAILAGTGKASAPAWGRRGADGPERGQGGED